MQKSLQNISHPNSTIHEKDHTVWSSWIYSKECKNGLTSSNQWYHKNKMKDKNHMVISIDAEKNIWQHSMLIYDKNSRQSGYRQNVPQHRISQVVLVVKNPPANAGDLRDEGSILGWGRTLGGGHINPLQYSLPGESHGERSLVSYSP